LELRCSGQSVTVECFLDAQGIRDADALVDRECLPEVCGASAGVAVLEVAVADSFQGARFLGGHGDVAGDSERLAVVVAGLAGSGGAGLQFAQAVERLRLVGAVADVARQLEGLLVAGGRGRVVAGQLAAALGDGRLAVLPGTRGVPVELPEINPLLISFPARSVVLLN
jgi:hypothetical protein